MENVITDQKGNYILVMRLEKPTEQFIPKFGNVHLFPGIYFYCGSAHGFGGIRSRITRHLNKESKRYWNIDYIKHHMEIVEVWGQAVHANNECAFSSFFSKQKNAESLIKGFGASDCKNKCKTHLWKFPPEKNIEKIFFRLRSLFSDLEKIYP